LDKKTWNDNEALIECINYNRKGFKSVENYLMTFKKVKDLDDIFRKQGYVQFYDD